MNKCIPTPPFFRNTFLSYVTQNIAPRLEKRYAGIYKEDMHMSTRIMLLSVLLALTGCQNETTSTNTDPISCTGFMSPSLSIYLLDSLSGENITNALVTLQTVNNDGAQSITVAWNDVQNSYFVNSIDLVEGVYSVAATESNYNSGVSLNNEFIVDTSCDAANA